jgi:hypothetical protein
MNETIKDFISGCIGGIAGTVVGHPFETVKGILFGNIDEFFDELSWQSGLLVIKHINKKR